MKHVLFFIGIFLGTNAFSQSDNTIPKFNDDLLDHLVGKWNVTSVAHGFSSTATISGEWTFNHQVFRLHFAGNEVIPWIGVPMEFDYLIGFNHKENRYVVHGVSVFGYDDSEGFWYGSRSENELKLIQRSIITSESDSYNVQRLIWMPAEHKWSMQSRAFLNGTEGEIFLDMTLTAADKNR